MKVEVLTIIVLLTVGLCGTAALAGAFPPPLAMAQTEGSIATVRVKEVVDRGAPESDSPTVLRVEIVSLLRKVGNGLPAQFDLKRAPRIALGSNDCSGRTPGLSYMIYDVPAVGAIQIVSATYSPGKNRAVQIGPYYAYSQEVERNVKKDIAAVSRVKSGFYAEWYRLQLGKPAAARWCLK